MKREDLLNVAKQHSVPRERITIMGDAGISLPYQFTEQSVLNLSEALRDLAKDDLRAERKTTLRCARKLAFLLALALSWIWFGSFLLSVIGRDSWANAPMFITIAVGVSILGWPVCKAGSELFSKEDLL